MTDTTTNTPIKTPFGFESTAAEVIAGIDLSGKRTIVTGGSSGIGAFSSAEWIAEGPSNELTNFASVDFSAATASTDGVAKPISAFSNDAITMETSSGVVRATPSSPPVTTAFSVTWRHS